MINSSSPCLANLKAIFFDLDDVLVFSETAHTHAWQISLAEFGVNPKNIDLQLLVGMSDSEQAKKFKQQYNLKQEAQVLHEHKRATFLTLIKNGLEAPLGRNAFLEKIAATHTIGLVSSSPLKIIHEVLNLEKIACFFDFIIGHEDCARHKPHPLPYQLALERANVAPHEALVIEDSVSGISAAQAASIPVVAILKNQRPEQILKGVTYFNSFTEIQTQLIE